MSIPRSPSWWDRNWKWFVPAGCLTLLGLGLAFMAGTAYFIFAMMKSAEVYQDALRRAQSSPAVLQALGEPLEDGLYVAGNIQVNGPTGSADLSFPVSGPRGRGTVYVRGAKSMGRWTLDELVVEVKASGERIDLLAETAP